MAADSHEEKIFKDKASKSLEETLQEGCGGSVVQGQTNKHL